MFIKKEANITKVQVNNNVFYYELSSKPNVEIIVIIVSMWKHHNFGTILTSYIVLNIQYAIGKGFLSRKRALYMGVNACFGPRRTNRPHETPDYGPGQ